MSLPMIPRVPVLLLAAFQVFAAPLCLEAGEGGERCDRAPFRWLRAQGFAAAAPRPMVRVDMQRRPLAGGAPSEYGRMFGYLLSESAEEIVLQGIFPEPVRVPRVRVRPHDALHATVVTLDLESEARRCLANLAGEVRSLGDEGPPYAGWEHHEFILLAAYCEAHGMLDHAAELCRRTAIRKLRYGRGDPPGDLVIAMEEGLSRRMLEHAGGLLSSAASREDMLRAYERVLESFPGTPAAEVARPYRERLLRMVAEERARSVRPPRDPDSLSLSERVEEWVFRLKDQVGGLFLVPGPVHLEEECDGEATPSARLVSLGAEAIPHLIPALADDRFSRVVEHRGIGLPSPEEVWPVGRCVESILAEVAGYGSFAVVRVLAETRLGRPPVDAREAATVWWETCRKDGDLEMFVSALQSGEGPDERLARIFAARHPHEAQGVLADLLARAGSGWFRAGIVRALSMLTGREAEAALEREASDGPDATARVEAMLALSARRPEQEEIGLLRREWERHCATPSGIVDHRALPVISAMLSAGSPDLVRALADGLPRLSPHDRMVVIDEVDSKLRVHWASGAAEAGGDSPGRRLRSAGMDLLAALLDDSSPSPVTIGGLANPPVRDLAARALARALWLPEGFDLAAPAEQREAAIVRLKRIWRESRPGGERTR